MPEPEDLTQVFVNITVSLSDELGDRLEADLSERDWVAISAALTKAVMRAGRVMANAIESTSPMRIEVLGERRGSRYLGRAIWRGGPMKPGDHVMALRWADIWQEAEYESELPATTGRVRLPSGQAERIHNYLVRFIEDDHHQLVHFIKPMDDA